MRRNKNHQRRNKKHQGEMEKLWQQHEQEKLKMDIKEILLEIEIEKEKEA